MTEHDKKSEEKGLLEARRALLKAGAYIAPAIIGSMLISEEAFMFAGPSCGPAGCPPNACGPNPCGPADNCAPGGGEGPLSCAPLACAPNACAPRACAPMSGCGPSSSGSHGD